MNVTSVGYVRELFQEEVVVFREVKCKEYVWILNILESVAMLELQVSCVSCMKELCK